MPESAIIIGDHLANLTPDGPDYRTKETQFVPYGFGGAKLGLKITERYQLLRTSVSAEVPAPFSPHPDDTDCTFRNFREQYDKTGCLSKLVLEYSNDVYFNGVL